MSLAIEMAGPYSPLFFSVVAIATASLWWSIIMVMSLFHSTTASGTLPMEQTKVAIGTRGP